MDSAAYSMFVKENGSVPTTATGLLFLDDAYLRTFEARVVGVAGQRVALDRTAFYATSGGQPHDTGHLVTPDGHTLTVTDVDKEGTTVWHILDGPVGLKVGDTVQGTLDWERRHRLMRTHTAVHVLCGVISNEWGVPVTGGNMEPLGARMDFEFDPLPGDFRERVTDLVNAEIAADRQIEVHYLPRVEALADGDLIRTKVNLIPAHVDPIRVVNIVGLDKQADGGTHVASTGEIGAFEVLKTESKGRGNKRLRIAVHDPR